MEWCVQSKTYENIQHFKYVKTADHIANPSTVVCHVIYLQVYIFGVIKVYSIDGGYNHQHT